MPDRPGRLNWQNKPEEKILKQTNENAEKNDQGEQTREIDQGENLVLVTWEKG